MRPTVTRRAFLKRGAAAGVMLGATPFVACGGSSPSRPRREQVAIVGAGLAGLTCAYRLKQAGIDAAVVEARDDRLGGRCWTERGFADGQAGERGGEFIDTNHERIRALVAELGLELEDREAAAEERGEVRGSRVFDGRELTGPQTYSGYAAMVRRLRADARDDADLVPADVAVAGPGDHGQGAGLAGLGRIDALGELQKAPRRFVDLVLAQLDLERRPATVNGPDHSVDLEILVLVLEDLGVDGLGVGPQIAGDQRLEEEPEVAGVLEDRLRRAAKRGDGQRGADELALRL